MGCCRGGDQIDVSRIVGSLDRWIRSDSNFPCNAKSCNTKSCNAKSCNTKSCNLLFSSESTSPPTARLPQGKRGVFFLVDWSSHSPYALPAFPTLTYDMDDMVKRVLVGYKIYKIGYRLLLLLLLYCLVFKIMLK